MLERPEGIRWSLLASPERWLETAFLSAMILVALVFHHRTTSSITAKDFYALWFGLLFTLLGGWIFIARREHRRVPLAFLIPLLAYLAYGTLRALSSPYPEHSWDAWRITLCSMSPMLPACLLMQSRAASRRVLFALTTVVWIVCLYALAQFGVCTAQAFLGWGRELDPVRWPWNKAPLIGSFLSAFEIDLRLFQWEDFPGFWKFPAVCSTFGNPTYLAEFLVLVVPLSFILWVASRGKPRHSRLMAAMTFLLAGTAMVATFSKGAMLGVLGAGVMLLYLLGQGRDEVIPPRWKRSSRIGARLLLGITIALLGIVFYLSASGPPILKMAFSTVRNRAIVYEATFGLIADHPLWGVSPGNFTIHFPEYLEGSLAAEHGWMESIEDKVMEHAHCELLEISADLGLVGLLLFLAFLGAGISWCVRVFCSSESHGERWILAGLVTGVVGGLFENLTSVSLRWMPSAWMFWAFVGASMGMAVRIAGKEAAPLSGQRGNQALLPLSVRGGVVLAAAWLVTFLFVPSARRFAADWHFVDGKTAILLKRENPENEFHRALELDPCHEQAHYLLGGCYYNAGLYEKAIEEFEKVRDLRGYVVVLAENMATSYLKMSSLYEKDFQRQEAVLKAIDLYEDSLRRHPTFPRLEDYLARAYHRIGLEHLEQEHRRKAIELYVRWFKWGGSYPRPDYALDLAKNYLLEKDYEKAFWQIHNAQRWKGDEQKFRQVLESLFEAAPAMRKKWDQVEEYRKARERRQRAASETAHSPEVSAHR
jgi:O-antigen ligase/DNA-binding SARP family transcriptional activator